MTTDATMEPIADPVGPIIQAGELAEAIAAAVEIDNPGKRVDIRSRNAYVRIEVDGGECILRRETVEQQLGRPFHMRELEIVMPAFVGRIDTGTEQVRFWLGDHPTTQEASA